MYLYYALCIDVKYKLFNNYINLELILYLIKMFYLYNLYCNIELI